MHADDPRLDQMLGETLQLMADSGVSTSSNPVSLGKFASQYHARMHKVLPALTSPAPSDQQALIEASVKQAVEATVKATVEATLQSLLSLQEAKTPNGRKVLTVMVGGKKTSVSIPAALFEQLSPDLGSKGVIAMAESFALTRPANAVLSRWVTQNLENYLILQNLNMRAGEAAKH